jgi:RNA polymerase sigma-B factor
VVRTNAPIRQPPRPGVARAGRAPAARDHLLFRRYRDHADPLDREELVRRFLPLARRIAARYVRGSEPFDDLLQVACLGLVRAIDRFDPSRGVAFSSYALPAMCGEIKRHYRDRTWVIRVPRDLQELALTIPREMERMRSELGRTPTVRELCARLDISERELADAVAAGAACDPTSLDGSRRGDDPELTLADVVPYDEPGYAWADDRAALEQLLRRLSLRDRELVRLRYEEDLTQGEIGRRVGLSRMQVSRMLHRIVGELCEAADGAATSGDGRLPTSRSASLSVTWRP